MLHVLDHPLIKHKLTIMRKKETGTKDFRQNLEEIGSLMCYEISKEFPIRDVEIETPVAPCVGKEISTKVVIVPILRAGMGMVNGFINLIPTAKVGHVGLYRNEETLKPVQYFAKFPEEIKTGTVIVIDPMLATGGSATAAIDILKERGAKKIILCCLVGVDEGIKVVQEHHPEVEIYLAAKDEKLNNVGYIVPGLGDAGDRIFGTK